MRPARFHILAVLFCVTTASALLAQENTFRAVFEREGGRVGIIGSFKRGGTTYISLTDLVTVARIGVYQNVEARKLELRLPSYRVKATAGSPFLVVTAGERQSVVQLPHEVLFAAGSYFLPLEESPSYLEILLAQPVAVERGLGLMRIGVQPAAAFDIPFVHFEPKTNGLLLRISATRRLEDVESWYSNGWLYVTIPEAHADTTAINAVRPAGIVRQIVAIQSPTAVQLTFRLSGSIAATELVRDESSNDLLIAVREEKGKPPEAKPPVHKAPEKSPEIQKPADQKAEEPEKEERKAEPKSAEQRQAGPDNSELRTRWRLDVIVLDAGHGGRDWGAIGITGAREKDIALGITLKLGRLIEKHLPGVRVVYTRKDDRFIRLDRRGQIANEAGGKLFISIHANSFKTRPSPKGFEVYLLRPARTEEAVAIAERENSVIQLEEGYQERYEELTEENFILVTMAQSAYVRSSELFADLVQQEMGSAVTIQNRGVKQAGFYVLVGASMPNILLETGYISHRSDEKMLRSESGQQKIAESVFRAIRQYKEEYNKLLQE